MSFIVTSLFRNFAAVAAQCQPRGNSFLSFPTWYKYLNVAYDSKEGCHIDKFNVPADFVLIALAIGEILLRIGGLVAFGFVIWGGIQYVTSQGEPDKTKKALETVMNAVIGMVISIFATAIIVYVGEHIG